MIEKWLIFAGVCTVSDFQGFQPVCASLWREGLHAMNGSLIAHAFGISRWGFPLGTSPAELCNRSLLCCGAPRSFPASHTVGSPSGTCAQAP